MKADQYVTVAREGMHESEINRSRFLCSLAPAATEQEAQDFVARIRKEHPTATHNCFAYVVGADASVQKASDDGEPGGTAGVPMLQMLMRRDIRYAVAVVTRYYGGVKLGAGGLIRAYGGVVGEALDELGTVTRRRYRLATVTVDHQRAGEDPERSALHRPDRGGPALRGRGGDRGGPPGGGPARLRGLARRHHRGQRPSHPRRRDVRALSAPGDGLA